MTRKLMRIPETLLVAAILACGIGTAIPARAQTANGGSVPQGITTPDPKTARKLGPCPSGWWSDRGVWACEPLPPRSQADCPPGQKFAHMANGTTGCLGGGGFVGLTATPIQRKCHSDSDCFESHVCLPQGVCQMVPYIEQKNPGN